MEWRVAVLCCSKRRMTCQACGCIHRTVPLVGNQLSHQRDCDSATVSSAITVYNSCGVGSKECEGLEIALL
eukprot:3936472-Rhodomonas_salina.3